MTGYPGVPTGRQRSVTDTTINNTTDTTINNPTNDPTRPRSNPFRNTTINNPTNTDGQQIKSDQALLHAQRKYHGAGFSTYCGRLQNFTTYRGRFQYL
jgi:hypothetical protein